MIGAVLNANNTRLDASTIAYILDHSEARVLLVDTELSGLAAEALQLAETAPLVIDIDDPEGPSGQRIGSMDYEDLLAEGQYFDLIIASEVIEHTADRPAFLSLMASFADPDPARPALAVLTTLNRSLPGVVLGKYAAEYVLGLAPKGAHDPKRFVRPSELQREAMAAGIQLDDITGIRPSLLKGFDLGGPPLINYAAAGLVQPGP